MKIGKGVSVVDKVEIKGATIPIPRKEHEKASTAYNPTRSVMNGCDPKVGIHGESSFSRATRS